MQNGASDPFHVRHGNPEPLMARWEGCDPRIAPFSLRNRVFYIALERRRRNYLRKRLIKLLDESGKSNIFHC